MALYSITVNYSYDPDNRSLSHQVRESWDFKEERCDIDMNMSWLFPKWHSDIYQDRCIPRKERKLFWRDFWIHSH